MADGTNRTDTEMMEAEMPSQPEVAPDDLVRNLLTLARQLINQGKPSQALQAVLCVSSNLTLSTFFIWSAND